MGVRVRVPEDSGGTLGIGGAGRVVRLCSRAELTSSGREVDVAERLMVPGSCGKAIGGDISSRVVRDPDPTGVREASDRKRDGD